MKRHLPSRGLVEGGTYHRAHCRLCGRPFVRVLSPGACARHFTLCDRCRVRAGATIEGGVEAVPSELGYLTAW